MAPVKDRRKDTLEMLEELKHERICLSCYLEMFTEYLSVTLGANSLNCSSNECCWWFIRE